MLSLCSAELPLNPELIEGMLILPVVFALLLVMRRTRRAKRHLSEAVQRLSD
ncbi:hypothetical protein LMG23994_06025 [Cupriavidus pinatubonensis]|uniref:Transmembrane protein n=1 Tax=Cupriavidus pinatubonensis TaxID=248026 RepID=A0ABM8Y015_9BURK|nr:hypothetical protein LMG23994_06025 [Cupriavidus pinatubonensis]